MHYTHKCTYTTIRYIRHRKGPGKLFRIHRRSTNFNAWGYGEIGDPSKDTYETISRICRIIGYAGYYYYSVGN